MGSKVSVEVDIQAAKHHAEFFLEWEMFRTKVVEKNKTIYVQQLFSENRSAYEIT